LFYIEHVRIARPWLLIVFGLFTCMWVKGTKRFSDVYSLYIITDTSIISVAELKTKVQTISVAAEE